MNIVSRLLAFIMLIISATSMWAWIYAQNTLSHSHPALFEMTFNTSVCYGLAGLVYCLKVEKSKVSDLIEILLGTILLTIAVIILFQYMFNLSIGIDQLFVKVMINTEFKNPGRMSSFTASGILCAGLSIILLRTTHSIKIYYLIYLLILTISIMGVFGVIQHKIFDLVDPTKFNVNKVGYQSAFCLILFSVILWLNWYNVRERLDYQFTDSHVTNLIKITILYFAFLVILATALIMMGTYRLEIH